MIYLEYFLKILKLKNKKTAQLNNEQRLEDLFYQRSYVENK